MACVNGILLLSVVGVEVRRMRLTVQDCLVEEDAVSVFALKRLDLHFLVRRSWVRVGCWRMVENTTICPSRNIS